MNSSKRFCRNHGLPLLFFMAVSVGVTWPTVRDLTTLLTGSGGDAKHFLWQMWHTLEALGGSQGFLYSSLLFFPVGISLLTHATGPIIVATSLPFWPFGPVAAYNGSLIIDVCLTGYCGYLLARQVGLRRAEALFCGLVLLMAEMHLAGLLGQKTKTLMVFAPLALLSFFRATKPENGRVWSVVTAFLLFLTLLYSGWQFLLTSAALGFFMFVSFRRSRRKKRSELLKRLGIFLVLAALLITPMIVTIFKTVETSNIDIDRRIETQEFSPDLIEFFVPSRYSRVLGEKSRAFLRFLGVEWSIESTVSLGWAGLLLVLVAAVRPSSQSRPWLILLLLAMVLSLGPCLKFLGKSEFTPYSMPIVLPYAFLSAIPGLEFARTPGRIMQIGFIALAISAGLGLSRVTESSKRFRMPVIFIAAVFLLLETWPAPWPQEELRPVPSFYSAIGNDPLQFGVLDLPLKPDPSSWMISYSSHYQMYQMTHRKGILLGYISRGYSHNPRIPCLSEGEVRQDDVTVDGRPSDCTEAVLYDLARSNYRYVVHHKPQERYPLYRPGSWGDVEARRLIEKMFSGRPWTISDELVTVYSVPSPDESLPEKVVLSLGDGWYERESEWRWASSPALLRVTSPVEQRAVLELVPHFFHSRSGPGSVVTRGTLTIDLGSQKTSVNVQGGETARIPLVLKRGHQTLSVSLELQAHEQRNFRPIDFGSTDPRLLSFAMRSINLKVSPGKETPGGGGKIKASQPPQSAGPGSEKSEQ